MERTIIAKNLLLGNTCDVCSHQFESIDVTTLCDTEKVFEYPTCTKDTGVQTCSEWRSMYDVFDKDMGTKEFAKALGVQKHN